MSTRQPSRSPGAYLPETLNDRVDRSEIFEWKKMLTFNRMLRLPELLLRFVRVFSSSIRCCVRLCPSVEPSSIEKVVMAPKTFFFRWMLT